MRLQLPASFRDRISRVFRPGGDAWLERLPDIVDECSARWSLTDLEQHANLSYSWVGRCRSPYGPAILKITVPNPEARSEIAALRSFASGAACALYAHDPALCAILVERLTPGETLWSVSELGTRVEVAGSLVRMLHAEPRNEPAGFVFPRFFDLARRAFARARGELSSRRAGAPWVTDLLRAVDLAEQMIDASDKEVLIHGDLHHGNILSSGSAWRIIDPKGILAPSWLEPGRFIRNQIGDAMKTEDALETERQAVAMAEAFAECVDRTPYLVARGAALDATVGACWSTEAQESDDRMLRTVATATELHRVAQLLRPESY
ncbi:MAG: aminoglycoside phosphotransferase family protein [Spirochaetota bacterium]